MYLTTVSAQAHSQAEVGVDHMREMRTVAETLEALLNGNLA